MAALQRCACIEQRLCLLLQSVPLWRTYKTSGLPEDYLAAVREHNRNKTQWNAEMTVLRRKWQAEFADRDPSSNRLAHQLPSQQLVQQPTLPKGGAQLSRSNKTPVQVHAARIHAAKAQARLAKAEGLLRAQARRKQLLQDRSASLLHDSSSWIRPEELSDRISHALDNPALFGIPAAALVDSELTRHDR